MAERRATHGARIEQVERRARCLVAASLAGLAAYVAGDSLISLAAGERPEASPVGIALAVASLAVMWWLARAKRRIGAALGSRAMNADAFQTEACFWLSLFVLIGVGATVALGSGGRIQPPRWASRSWSATKPSKHGVIETTRGGRWPGRSVLAVRDSAS